MILAEKFIRLYNDLCSENFLPSSGASVALYMTLIICKSEANGILLNKSAIIDAVPSRLGSISRRRYVLDFLIHAQALHISVGHKRSEKNVRQSQRIKQILSAIDV